MKPHLLKIPLKPEHSFNVRYDIVPHFYNKWHYHPEVELVHIIKGSGRQFIGDNIHHFKPGDMILLGTDLPHFFVCHEFPAGKPVQTFSRHAIGTAEIAPVSDGQP